MTLRSMLLAMATLGFAGPGYMLSSDEFGHPKRAERFETRPQVFNAPPLHDPHRAEFVICNGPVRANCVVDGDTFWFKGIKIRVADIDAPEISEPQCAGERQAGIAARNRLLEMLNAGSFSLLAGWRDEDRYGRKLRIVARDDTSLGEILVREGLAWHWGVSHFGWCFPDDPG